MPMFSDGPLESISFPSGQNSRGSRTRRRILLSVALVGSLAAGVTVLLLAVDGPRIDRERFDRIREGMTRAEVIALLGALPGDYTFRKDLGALCSNNLVTGAWLSLGWTEEEWTGDG